MLYLNLQYFSAVFVMYLFGYIFILKCFQMEQLIFFYFFCNDIIWEMMSNMSYCIRDAIFSISVTSVANQYFSQRANNKYPVFSASDA